MARRAGSRVYNHKRRRTELLRVAERSSADIADHIRIRGLKPRCLALCKKMQEKLPRELQDQVYAHPVADETFFVIWGRQEPEIVHMVSKFLGRYPTLIERFAIDVYRNNLNYPAADNESLDAQLQQVSHLPIDTHVELMLPVWDMSRSRPRGIRGIQSSMSI
jgi:hypothetical protein